MKKSIAHSKTTNPSNIKSTGHHHSKKSKIIPKINEEFFEKLFLLEMNYRKTLSPDYINQIVTLYMQAIEYYEFKKDKKTRDYQNRLQNFMIQPEVMKYLNKAKNAKTEENSKKLSSSKGVLKRKSELKIKFDYLSKISGAVGANENLKNQAKTIIGQPKVEETKKKIQHLITQDLDNQSKSFKEKMLLRKNKSTKELLKKPIQKIEKIEEPQSERRIDTEIREEGDDEGEEIEIKRVLTEANNSDENNENVVNVDRFEDFLQDDEPKEEVLNEKDNNEDKKEDTKEENQDENKKEIMNNLESIEKPNEEIKDLFPKVMKEEVTNSQLHFRKVSASDDDSVDSSGHCSSSSNLDISNEDQNLNSRISQVFDIIESNKNIGPKQQKGFNDIKNTLEKYVDNFNATFYKDIFAKFSKQVKKLMDEKFNKYIEISKMYLDQINEIKAQLSELDNNSPNCEALENVMDSLKEEQRNELDLIEDEYNEKIQSMQREFKVNEFKLNPAILLLEEQFRLNMCNKINDLLLP